MKLKRKISIEEFKVEHFVMVVSFILLAVYNSLPCALVCLGSLAFYFGSTYFRLSSNYDTRLDDIESKISDIYLASGLGRK